jgi:hypothetical protein
MARTALLTLWFLALTAPAALAHPGQDQGQGLYGETTDKTVTFAGFILIAGIPLMLLCFSLLQRTLESRKDRRKAAAKARTARADVRGGW